MTDEYEQFHQKAKTILADYSRGSLLMVEAEAYLLALFTTDIDKFINEVEQWRDEAEQEGISRPQLAAADEGLVDGHVSFATHIGDRSDTTAHASARK